MVAVAGEASGMCCKERSKVVGLPAKPAVLRSAELAETAMRNNEWMMNNKNKKKGGEIIRLRSMGLGSTSMNLAARARQGQAVHDTA